MLFVDIETREKIDFANLKLRFPHLSIPPDPTNEVLAPLGHVRFVEVPAPTENEFADVVEGTPTAEGLQQWVVTPWSLERTKDALKARVNALRDQKETEGFVFGGKLFESDERSVARISNAALTAQSMLAAGQPFAIEWTASDNTTMLLVDSDMLAFQGTLTMRAGMLHAHARVLKYQIDAAATDEDAAAIDITAGWPA